MTFPFFFAPKEIFYFEKKSWDSWFFLKSSVAKFCHSGSIWYYKSRYWVNNCKCSLHTRLANDNSPQPKKNRNSWRQQEYPDDCRLNWLRAGKIKIPEKWKQILLIGYSLSAVHLWLLFKRFVLRRLGTIGKSLSRNPLSTSVCCVIGYVPGYSQTFWNWSRLWT